MTLEQQVCSLKLAKRLKELGVKQESFFGWYFPSEDKVRKDEKWDAPNIQIVGSGNEWSWHDFQCSAFTVAEIGEMLPALDGSGWFMTEKLTSDWHVAFCASTGHEKFATDAPTEADARAKMLIYLLENKIITL